MEPLISVIVPIYNVEQYLKKCVDSIVNQTYRSLQIILVDDGSPDRSGEICERYAQNDKRIQVLHKMRGGYQAHAMRVCGLLPVHISVLLMVMIGLI